MSKYTNEQIAAKEELWNDYYNTSATSPFSDCTYGERLKMLNRDYPDEKSDEDRVAISAAARALGSIKSPRKAETSRANGKLGGRGRMTIITVTADDGATQTFDRADLGLATDRGYNRIEWMAALEKAGYTALGIVSID